MIDDIFSYLNKIGEDYHKKWVIYFTKDYSKSCITSNQTSVVDTFIKSFDYKPCALKTVLNTVKVCDTAEEITKALGSLFMFNRYSPFNTVFFLKTVAEMKPLKNSPKNAQFVRDSIIRCFYAFSYQFKAILRTSQNKNVSKLLPDECWTLFPDAINCIISADFIDLDDKIPMMSYFYVAMGDPKQIFSPDSDEKLRKLVTQLMSLLLPFQILESDFKKSTTFEFLKNCLMQWSQNYDKNQDLEFFPIVHAFYSTMPNILTTLQHDSLAQCIDLAQKIIFILTEEETPNITILSSCFNLIRQAAISKLCSEGAYQDVIVKLYNYACSFQNFAVETRKFDNDNIDDFDNQLIPDLGFNITTFESRSVIQLLQLFIKSMAGESEHIVMNLIPYIYSNPVETKMRFTTSILLSLYPLSAIGPDLLFSLLDSMPVLEAIKNEDDLNCSYFRSALLSFLAMYGINNPSQTYMICEWIKIFIEKEEFCLISFFIPVFRTFISNDIVEFLDSTIASDFTQKFGDIEQNLSERDNKAFDQIILFTQFATKRAAKLILTKTSSFIPFCDLILVSKRYNYLLPKYYVYLLQASNSDDEKEFKFLHNLIFNGLCFALTQVNPLVHEEVFIQVIVSVLTSFVKLKHDLSEQIIDFRLLILLSKICEKFHSEQYFSYLIQLINILIFKFDETKNYMLSQSAAPIFASLSQVQLRHVSDELIYIMKNAIFSLIKQDVTPDMTISIPQFAILLLTIVKDKEQEESIYEFLCNTCQTNIVNSFLCFQANIINFLLKRLTQKQVTGALNLFKIIASEFFSPLALRDVIKSISQMNDVDSQLGCLEKVNELFLLTEKFSVSSFFHFSGKQSITAPYFQEQSLTYPFAICTSIRLTKFDSNQMPVINITMQQQKLVSVLVAYQTLKVQVVTQEGMERQFSIFPIKLNSWHNIFLRFTPTELQSYDQENKLITYSVNMPHLEQNQMRVRIGMSRDQKYFVGDIGAIFILPSKNIEKTTKKANKAIERNEPPSKYIFSAIPSNVDNKLQRLMSTTKNSGKRAKITAVAVPFINSIVDVLKFDSTYNLILPLFLKAKNQNVLNSFLTLLKNVISSDEYLKQLWQNIGGFGLFASIMTNINPVLFNDKFADNLKEIYDSLTSDMKKDFVENILLNFNLILQKGFQFSHYVYSTILPEMISEDPKIFEFSTQDNLIYQICSKNPLKPFKFEFDDYIPFNYEEMNETDLSNVYPHIFNCLAMIFKISPNFPSMLFLYLNGLHCDDLMIQKNILKTLQRLFIEHDFMRYAFSNLAKALDGFTSLYLKSKSSEVKFLTLKAMTLLYSMDEKMTVKYNLSISTIINEETLENQKIDFLTIDFFNQLLTVIFDVSNFNEDFLKSGSHQIVYPQILVMLFKYANDFNLPENYLPKIYNSMIDFPNSLANVFGVASWLYYFTLFIKKYNYEPKLLASVLKQNMHTKDEKYEILFSILSSDEILTLLSLLIEQIDDLEKQNEMYLVRLCKISCMFLQKNKNEEFVVKTAKILGFLFNKNMSLNISINDKNINILAAFTNIVGLYPNITKEIYEQTMSVNKESSITELAEAMISEPVEDMFYFEDFVFKPDEKLVLIENKTAFYDLTEFNKKSYESKILQQKKIFYSFLRLVKTDGGPWHVYEDKVHWRYSSRVNLNGETVFMRRDLNFDDHKKASNMRDSTQQNENEEEEENFDEIKVKKISALSFVPKFGELMKSLTSFSVTLRKLSGFYKGHLRLFPNKIIFDGVYTADTFGATIDPMNNYDLQTKYIEINVNKISYIFRRFYMHNEIGIEIFLTTMRSYLFYFSDINDRDEFEQEFQNLKIEFPNEKTFSLFRKATNSLIQNISAEDLVKKSKIIDYWRDQILSNYQYLYLLNIVAGRSFNDISQYPVFPWVISDYKRQKFDVNDVSFFRDFSKPLGAINEKRFNNLLKSYEVVDDPTQKCLYRSNMSNPSSVCGYLIRTEPFTSLHIRLQDGKFDHPGRLFRSIISTWKSVSGLAGDYRELIPQFYSSRYFLLNSNRFDLGKNLKGKVVDDVELPNWCISSTDFIWKMRYALECPYVSQHINEWIDLVFGIFQRSEQHKNVYHPFSYHESLTDNLDEDSLALIQNHCANFGSLPTKLFTSLHPIRTPRLRKSLTSRNTFELGEQKKERTIRSSTEKLPTLATSERVINSSLLDNTPIILNGNPILFENGVCVTNKGQIIKDIDNNPVVLNDQSIKIPSESFCVVSGENYDNIFYCQPKMTIVKCYSIEKKKEIGKMTHENCVVDCLTSIGENFIVIGGSDSVLYVWDANNFNKIASLQFHSFPIQSISGNIDYDVIASIDTSNTIFITSPSEKRLRNSFSFDTQALTVSKLRVTERGEIIVSSFSEVLKSTVVNVFDLCGNVLYNEKFPFEIIGIMTTVLPDSQMPAFVLSKSDKVHPLNNRVDGDDWITKIAMRDIRASMDSEWVFLKSRKLIFLTPKGDVKFILL